MSLVIRQVSTVQEYFNKHENQICQEGLKEQFSKVSDALESISKSLLRENRDLFHEAEATYKAHRVIRLIKSFDIPSEATTALHVFNTSLNKLMKYFGFKGLDLDVINNIPNDDSLEILAQKYVDVASRSLAQIISFRIYFVLNIAIDS